VFFFIIQKKVSKFYNTKKVNIFLFQISQFMKKSRSLG